MDPVALGVQALGGIFQAIGGGRRRREAQRRQREAQQRLSELEAGRQDIINPFAGAASQLSNPFANLTVATQAAEMQAQQTDLSLASALDTLRATGTGAGGATALAAAALKAKQGVAASIEQQEAKNAQLRAQGEAALQRQLYEAEVKGRSFVFGQQERRELQQLNRAQQQIMNAQARAEAGRQAQFAGLGTAFGALGGFALSGGFNQGGNNNGGMGETSGNNNQSRGDFGGSGLGDM
jgi:hypothetical protein|tara:strand:+ start:4057 stop:4770 length:714 start_codon:yes stop_codon:yes gene_type:complete